MADPTAPPWLTELPEAEHPDLHAAGECPWVRFEEATHESWGYRHDQTLIVRSHAVAKEVLSDRRFKQGMIARLREKAPDLDPRFLERRRKALLAREGPDHQRMRRLASKSAFTPKAANRHRPFMQSVMGALADEIPDDGVYDAVELIHPYPSRVIAHVLGSRPDEVTSFSSLIETVFDAQRGRSDAVDQAWNAVQQLDAHITELIDRKRNEPGEDLITDLIRAETEEGNLSAEDVHTIAVAVVMAGTETTRNSLTRGLLLLADRPEIWAHLVDDDHLGAAVEEILRFAPLAPVRRVPSEHVQLQGIDVPKDALVIIDFGATNRDPAVIDDPHTFRVDRLGPSQHLSLSHGHKYCLGANLARAEMIEALRVLRSRFHQLELVEPAEWLQAGGIPRAKTMMMRFIRG